jgi:hypothetical protein
MMSKELEVRKLCEKYGEDILISKKFSSEDKVLTMQIRHEKHRFKRAKVKFSILSQGVDVDLSSDHLPSKLLGKLCKLCNENSDYKNSITKMYEFLHESIIDNKLIYCMPEINRVRNKLIKGNEKSLELKKLVIDEKSGLIKLLIYHGKYKIGFEVSVPDLYPFELITFKIKTSNFPDYVIKLYEAQAIEGLQKNILHKIHFEEAFQTKGERLISKTEKDRLMKQDLRKKKSDKINYVNTEALQNMKHDVKYLMQSKELQQVNSSYNKQLHKHEFDTKTRKNARRTLKKLANAEDKIHKEREAKELENLEIMNLGFEERDEEVDAKIKENVKGIFGLCKLLIIDLLLELPRKKCPISKKQLFPDNPKDIGTKNLPVRPSCGCFFSYKAFNEFMINPPFDNKKCPNCGQNKIYHAKWKETRHLEKNYANRQARERELEEIDYLFE